MYAENYQNRGRFVKDIAKIKQCSFFCLTWYDSVVLTDAGRAFQAGAAATGNAQLPSVVCHVVGTSNVDVDPEQS